MFIFVLSSLEGSTSNSKVLRGEIRRLNGLRVNSVYILEILVTFNSIKFNLLFTLFKVTTILWMPDTQIVKEKEPL